jgi:diguanylate cyclase (GGDEF)-like protein
VATAEDGKMALGQVREQRPDLVLLDVIMPEMNGLEVCRILKAKSSDGFLPVIILTSKNDMESRVEGLKLGADDYMTKPADSRELLARIEALLRIKDLQDRIATSLEQVKDKTVTDQLTGLYNARYLETRLRDEFKRAERYSEPLSCIVITADGLASLLAAHGRELGEEIIKELAEILRGGIREFDVVVRSAENRFVILLPRTHFTGSLSVATRIWQRVQDHPFRKADQPLQVGISMGVSFFPNKDVASADALMDQAVQALDKAQEAGNNQICLYQHTTYFYRPDMGK